ncbi:hypothetical protein [Clostridium paraputrificum]|uniref:hypothetical protein n=1 Tax=Clostridium paraputrificum TaxID=29363 RepID=UPI000DCF856C|nr:hypothetical protein [Clostridium paraputrificum]MDB2115671.1 hypothetical protein [Clostridium paraputrificum]
MKDIVTKKNLEEMINRLDNGIDKFILAGFFYGLNGEAGYKEQLLNLEVEAIDLENKKINLPDGREVIMDELLEKVCKEAINQKIYTKLGSQGRTNEDYLLNEDSKYIIKVKPTKANNNGLSPLGAGGIKKRMTMLSDYLGVKLTPSILKVSGVYELLKSQQKRMTIAEAESLLKKNGLSIRRNNLIPILKEINGGK